MKVIIAENYSHESSLAADIIERTVRAKPDCCQHDQNQGDQ